MAVFGPRPTGAPEDPFEYDEAYMSSITWQLYQHIPEKIHSLLDAKTYASFAKDVCYLLIFSLIFLLALTCL